TEPGGPGPGEPGPGAHGPPVPHSLADAHPHVALAQPVALAHHHAVAHATGDHRLADTHIDSDTEVRCTEPIGSLAAGQTQATRLTPRIVVRKKDHDSRDYRQPAAGPAG